MQQITPQDITSTMSCPTCGMYPAKYPAWQTQVIFTDNSHVAFDGGKCMFRYLLNTKQFDPNRTSEDIAQVLVKDFLSGTWIDGKKAAYVVGSSVMGPMGKELIPFSSLSSAQAFQQQNGGSIAHYEEITMATVKPLMGGMMHHKKKMPGMDH